MVHEQSNPRVEIIPITDEHAEAVADFISKVWSSISVEEIRRNWAKEAATNPVYPGEASPAFAFFSDDVIIGYIGTIPTRFWDGENVITAYWMKGFWVLEEYRDGPVGFFLLKKAMEHLDLAGVLTVASASRRLFEGVGFINYGKLNNHLALVNPSKVLRSIDLKKLGISELPKWFSLVFNVLQRSHLAGLSGFLFGVLIAIWKKCFLLRSGRYQLSLEHNVKNTSQVTALWESVSQELGGASVRDGSYFPWRYDETTEGSYSYAMIHNGDNLSGLAVVRHPAEGGDERLSGLKVASLSDIIYSPNDKCVGLAVLAGAEKLAKKLGADALICSVSHQQLTPLLLKAGYFKLPGNVYFLLRNPDNKYIVPKKLTDWWITRGDASSDETF